MKKLACTAVVGVVTIIGGMTVAQATFTGVTSSGTNQLALDTLDPPTSVASVRLSGNNDVSWTATVDNYADGYLLERSTQPTTGFSLLATIGDRTTTSYSDDVCLSLPCAASYGSTGGNGETNDDEHAITVPAGTQAGDLLITAISVNDQDGSPSTPSGWTSLADVVSGTETRLLIYYRVATGSEPASYTFNWADIEQTSYAMVRYTDVDTSSPIHASDTASGTGGHPVAPSITTTVDGAMVLRIGGINDRDITGPPAGYTQRADHYAGSDAGYNFSDQAQSSAGSTGSIVWPTAGTTTRNWAAATIAITPEQPPTMYYRLRSTAGNWQSANSSTASS